MKRLALLRGAPTPRSSGRGDLVRPNSGAQRLPAGEGARAGSLREPRDRPPQPAPLLEAPGGGEVSGRDREPRPGDRGVRRGGPRGVADPAAGSGRSPSPESGDPSQEDQEVAGAVLPCLEEEGPEGALGGLRLLRGGLPRGGGEAARGRPDRGIPARELSAPAAVRGSLRGEGGLGRPVGRQVKDEGMLASSRGRGVRALSNKVVVGHGKRRKLGGKRTAGRLRGGREEENWHF